MDRKKIIVVDDNLTNRTVCKNILKTYYEVYPVPSASKMFELMGRIQPDLVLLDVDMPEMNGYEAARILKNSSEYKDVPFLFVSANSDEQSEMQGLNLGALDYIYKPFASALLLRRIETHLSLIESKKELRVLNDSMQKMLVQKMAQVWKLQNGVLNIIAELVEFRDKVTGGHIVRTQAYLGCLVEQFLEDGLYLEETALWDLDFVIPSAQLHDLGKIGISDAILNKPGKLDDEEFEIMKSHVQIGVEAINQIGETADDHGFFRHAELFAGTHHEKWDGTGYPNRLAGLDIPLEGRLMAIADVYDALISARPYKKPFTPSEAARIIIEGRGTHFDPQLVDVFSEISDQFEEIVEENQKP